MRRLAGRKRKWKFSDRGELCAKVLRQESSRSGEGPESLPPAGMKSIMGQMVEGKWRGRPALDPQTLVEMLQARPKDEELINLHIL